MTLTKTLKSPEIWNENSWCTKLWKKNVFSKYPITFWTKFQCCDLIFLIYICQVYLRFKVFSHALQHLNHTMAIVKSSIIRISWRWMTIFITHLEKKCRTKAWIPGFRIPAQSFLSNRVDLLCQFLIQSLFLYLFCIHIIHEVNVIVTIKNFRVSLFNMTLVSSALSEHLLNLSVESCPCIYAYACKCTHTCIYM